MGCDGGTIPKRDELVRKKKKPEQKDKDSELSFRWKHCSITQQPLQTPIVACGMGRLYNKDSVIEALLDRSNLPETAQHIKNLKDIKDLQLTPNPSFKSSAEKGDSYVDRQSAPYICPVIGLEMNGKFRFVFLWRCGCVMSERALKEVESKLCHKCQQPFSQEDIVVLNGSSEDLDAMKTKLEARQARLKADKKAHNDAKRRGKVDTTPSSTEASNNSQDSGNKLIEPSSKNHNPKEEPKFSANGEKGSQKSKLQNGKSDLKAMLKVGSKLNGVKDKVPNIPTKRPMGSNLEDPVFKKTKGSYSVANDPKATDVFKSLFTSHQKAQQQNKAHWITYNPFYN